MQKELSDKLGIAKSNVGSWLQRGQIPGNVIVQCALDTGADVEWLITGGFANSNFEVGKSLVSGKALYEQIQASGGKSVLRRMLDAYGFRTQKELGDFLDISTATISTWVRREYFPGDAVVTCALDTGVSLLWLSTGQGSPRNSDSFSYETTFLTLSRWSISSGTLNQTGSWICDPTFIPVSRNNLGYVEKDLSSWLVDFDNNMLGNGTWLLNIDGVHDVYSVSRIPGNKIEVSGFSSNFECAADDVICVGKIIKQIANL
ncbi:helix-turn-helix domain-containing protein [Serratia marcescens]|nr:helix-turn-helix domain-containing protein [Serratia marcescens]